MPELKQNRRSAPGAKQPGPVAGADIADSKVKTGRRGVAGGLMDKYAGSAGLEGLRNLYEGSVGPLSEEIVQEVARDPEPPPPFPWLIVYLALLKDLVIDVGTVTIGSWLGAVIVGVIIFLWGWGRMNKASKFAVKAVLKKAAKKFIGSTVAVTIAEAIPVLSVLPITFIFVLIVHYQHKKIVQIFIRVAETITGADGEVTTNIKQLKTVESN